MRHAALELYAERGFEHVTVAEIAERAGLTERTFYRHFVDKREVLFPGSAELPARLAGIVTEAPGSTADGGGDGGDRRLRPVAARPTDQQLRQRVINANPELRERELIKLGPTWPTR